MRCEHCGKKDCTLDAGACLVLQYTCPVCEKSVQHSEADWDNGKPFHPLCLTALLEVKNQKAPELQEVDNYVKGAIIGINLPCPLLLTVDMSKYSLAKQIEDILTDVILSYRENPPTYDWATETLDMSQAETAAQNLLQNRLTSMRAEMAKIDKKLRNSK